MKINSDCRFNLSLRMTVINFESYLSNYTKLVALEIEIFQRMFDTIINFTPSKFDINCHHSWTQFHRAAKQENLLSSGKFCLAKTGYQPKCHVKYTVCDWFPAIFCLVSKFVKLYCLLRNSMKLGPGFVEITNSDSNWKVSLQSSQS